MSAKRKKGHREQRAQESGDPFPDAWLAALLETEEGIAWVKEFLAEAGDQGRRRKKRRKAARGEAYVSFVRYLEELPASHDLPAGHNVPKGFQSKWLKWLRRFEREEIAKLQPKYHAATAVCK